jgi:hypothetical protein
LKTNNLVKNTLNNNFDNKSTDKVVETTLITSGLN